MDGLDDLGDLFQPWQFYGRLFQERESLGSLKLLSFLVFDLQCYAR